MTAHALAWTTDRVEPVIDDLVRSELGRLRPGAAGRHIGDRPADGIAPAPADSLELLALATAVSRQFHIHETGLDDLLLAHRSLADWADTVVRSRRISDTAVTFSTSGSTGEPKFCTHLMADLETETRVLQGLFAGRRRVLRVQPAHHIYGFLFTFLLPAALDIPVVDARGYGPASLLRRARPGDLIVAHPHYLELASSLPGGVAEDVSVVTSTSPCDPSIWRRLVEAGVDSVVEIYGSSETAGIGWRRHPEQPFELMPHWRRIGRDVVRQYDAGRLSAIPDNIEWIGESEFRIRSRLDGAVQIGGTNVFPGRVRDILLQHPAVADGAVRLMRPEEGRRLKAFIVPSNPDLATDSLADELMRWVESRASPPEVPRAFRFGPTLPRSDAGKLADWSVLEPDASA